MHDVTPVASRRVAVELTLFDCPSPAARHVLPRGMFECSNVVVRARRVSDSLILESLPDR